MGLSYRSSACTLSHFSAITMARYIVLMVQLVLILLPTLVASYAFSCTHISPLFNRVTTILHTAKTESATCATQNVVSSTDRYSSRHSLHLISLPPKDDSFSLPAESLVRECWKWKDDVLGDGRDYFVPRPKSLRAFHSLFVGMEICVDINRCEEHEIDGKMACVLDRVTLKIPSIGCGEGSRFEVEFPMEQLSAVKQSKGVECTPKTYLIEECVALSNCARFEVILALEETTQQQSSENYSVPLNAASTVAEYAARLSVAYHLWRQTQNYRSNNDSLLRRTGLAYWLDLPDSVETSHASCNYFTENNTRASSLLLEHTQDIKFFSQRLACIEGGLSISKHLSLIASGLAPRTNRPTRDVIFRPYSSRDAHILLQLKRTVEVVSVLGVKSEKNAMDQYHKRKDSGGRGRIKILLDGALNAGKAVRNENIVPEIRQLKEFGSDETPPIGLANAAAEVGYSSF
ncbi:hypothetical protein ACHAWX_001384 [Stephanocyclus meneghinianus]